MKKLRNLFAMCLLLLIATTATAQTQSDNADAKAASAAKADVNGDGVVNEADIEEIIEIMKKDNAVKYYWYVGQENPADNSTITSTVGAEGWRLIEDPNSVTKSNPLFNTTEAIVGTKPDYWYIALPADKSYKIYDSDHADQIAEGNFEKQSSTVSFNNVNYTVYKGFGTPRKWWGYTIY